MASDTNTHVGGELRPRAHHGGSHPSGRHGGEPTLADQLRAGMLLRGWDADAVPTAAARLSALCATPCAVRVRGPLLLPPEANPADHGYVVTLCERGSKAPCAWLELEASLARALVDLALGGTGAAAELGLVEPLDATREGVLLYLVACVLHDVPQEALTIASIGHSHGVPRPERLACSALVTVTGHTYGAHLSVAPARLDALPGLATALAQREPPAWVQGCPCEVFVELARGSLPGAAFEALEPGDLLVPDEVWAAPGQWRTATLRAATIDAALATLRVDEGGVLRVDEHAPVAVAPLSPLAGHRPFSVVAARATVSVGELTRWLRAGELALHVDPELPLTLVVDGRAVAKGELMRDHGDVGLAITRVLRGAGPPAGATLPAVG